MMSEPGEKAGFFVHLKLKKIVVPSVVIKKL
jgi:hypothetical protein